MFTSKQRLKKTKEIDKVFKLGRSYFLPGIGIKVLANSQSFSRVTVFVSKKVSKSAVVRNHLKRQIRAILQEKIKNLTPVDMVVICQPSCLEFSFETLEKNIITILAKLKI